MLSEVNVNLFRAVNDLGKEYPFLNPVMVFIAEYLLFFLVVGALGYWLTRNQSNKVMVLCGLLTVLFAEIIARIAGMIHSNHQPFAELANVNQLIEKTVDNSFPSDHTILFFSLCVTYWLFKRGWGFLMIIVAIIVGISRIWVGVHYPADVFVGSIISILSAVMVYYVVPKQRITMKIIRGYERVEHNLFKKQKESKSKDM